MKSITHTINQEGNVVIDAIWDNTYGAVINPRIIGGSSIITYDFSNPKEMKERITSLTTNYKGKKNDVLIVVEDDNIYFAL